MDDTSFANSSSSSAEDAIHDEGRNLESSVLYVEQELHTLGLPSIVDQESSDINRTKVLNVLQKLLLMQRHNLKVIDEQRDSLKRGKSDVLFQREAQARLKEDIRSGEKELAQLEDKERQLNQKIKSLTSKLKAEQDEVRRLKVSMQYKETQRNHENKKKEKEFERLKQKLGQIVSDKSHERRLGVSMLNALQKSDGKRKLWAKPGSGNEDMYRVIIGNYEERQKELMLENSSLRESLAGMEKQLVCLLNERQATLKDQNSEVEEVSETMADLSAKEEDVVSSGRFQMPFDIVRDDIEQSFQDKCKMVKQHIDELKLRIEGLETNSGESYVENESEIRKLEHQLSDYRHIIGQQEEMLLQKTVKTDQEQTSDLLSESRLWLDKDQLEKERKLFIEEKKNLETNRLKYMEAIQKLDRERRKFESERAAFFQESGMRMNSTQELDSFFTQLCSTPSQSDSSLSKYASASMSSTPSCKSDPTLSSSKHTTGLELQDNTRQNCEVDLNHDLSLCSDDGMSVLNERPAVTSTAKRPTN